MPHFYRGELVGTSRRYDERLTVALLAMRERFRGPQRFSSHPAAAFDAEDFGPLLARVETGPETWREEIRAEREAEYAEEEDEVDAEEAGAEETDGGAARAVFVWRAY